MDELQNLLKELESLKKQIKENKDILLDPKNQEIFNLAQKEINDLEIKKERLEKKIEKSQNKKSKCVIIEIRAGAGGQEAALFADDLFNMYSKYAQSQNWKETILDSHPTSLNGLKEIVFELTGPQTFQKLQYEAGVHRVQRTPITEKSGRIHTSTASVAILPKPEKTEIRIKPEDLKIDFFGSSGPGGQNVNKRQTAVRITHLPTGLIVSSQTTRNQKQNRINAMAILQAKLLEKNKMRQEAQLGSERKNQIGRAQRAEKIRTYNFPQDRVTDHRIKKSWHNIEGIMDGKIDPIIKALKKNDQDSSIKSQAPIPNDQSNPKSQ